MSDTPPDAGTMQAKPLGVDPSKPVGPGNPPATGTWKPGKSGNPAGKIPGTKNMSTIARELFDVDITLNGEMRQMVAAITGKHVDKVTGRELAMIANYAQALRGKTHALRYHAEVAGEHTPKSEVEADVKGTVQVVTKHVLVRFNAVAVPPVPEEAGGEKTDGTAAPVAT